MMSTFHIPNRAGLRSNLFPLAAFLVAGIVILSGEQSLRADGDKPADARDLYNQGTRQISAKKLREAEGALQAAVASQNHKVQETALYNLGEVRFQQGVEELKKAGDNKGTKFAAKHAEESGDSALRAVEAALNSPDVQEMVSAYMQGKGARKELKAATEAVKKALESNAAVLNKWRRASGDFKSAHELKPADRDAEKNAEAVDRSIALLVDRQNMMMPAMDGMQKQRGDLGKKLSELKKKMPEDVGKQMKGGEEEDDEEEDKGKDKEPKEGQEERPQKPGDKMQLTLEEAERMLDMLRLDTNRKLSLLGEEPKEAPKPGDRKRRDW